MPNDLPNSRLRSWIARVSFTTMGTGSELVLRFFRTFILSHLLTRAEFGVTIALSTVIFISEMVTDVGFDRFVLNTADDDAGHILSTTHLLQIVRGLILAIGVAVCAKPLASIFGVPQFQASFMLIGLAPFIRGFGHLGVKQVQRVYDYRPESISIVAAQISALIAAFAAGYWLRDHRAIIVAFVVEAIVFVIFSHSLTTRPFMAGFARGAARRAFAYGLPLIGSGLAGAVAAQFDRVIVGYFFGIETLAVYGVIMTVAMVPLSSVYRIASSLFSAMLARDRSHTRRFEASYLLVTWGFVLLGFVYAAGLALGLDVVTPFIFGQGYAVDPVVHLLVALLALIRVQRWSATLLCLAVGATGRFAIANSIASSGILFGTLFVYFRRDVASLLTGALVGELLACLSLQLVVLARMPNQAKDIHRTNIGSALGAAVVAFGLFLLPEASMSSRLTLAALFLPVVALDAFGLSRSWDRREKTRESWAAAWPSLSYRKQSG